MSYNQKVITSSLLALVVISYGAVRYYQKTHPKYVPPPPREEVEITIIPGWNLRQVAEYFVLKGLATSTEQVYAVTGAPAVVRTPHLPERDVNFPGGGHALTARYKPSSVSYEGYLAPETYRVYADASFKDVIIKLLLEQDDKLQSAAELGSFNLWTDDKFRDRHAILTMASIIEKEVKHDEDRAKVADILWRRLKIGWALQVDSTVHYMVGRTGDVFTTTAERAVDSPWNTYKYPGLPPGPISNPSVESIKAALYPEKNNYWYFLSGRDGKMYYAKTLEEHNRNKRYL